MHSADWCSRPERAGMSSTFSADNSAAKCIDGSSGGDSSTDVCHSKREKYPFFILEYDPPAKVSQVLIYNRRDAGGALRQDTENMVVIVADTEPLPGHKAEGIIKSSQL